MTLLYTYLLQKKEYKFPWVVLFFFTIIFISANQLFAQLAEIKFDQIGLEQGLSQSTVYALTQDKFGFMWFGTQDGLNRYDGYSFQVFKNNPMDSNSLLNNSIRALVCDRKGDIWIGTRSGVDRYVISANKFYHYLPSESDPSSLSNNLVSCIFESSKGDIWIGTSLGGLNHYDPVKGKFTSYKFNVKDEHTLSSNNVTAISEDNSGNIWIATLKGACRLTYQDGKISFIRYLQDDFISALCPDKNGGMWIGTWGRGLIYFNEKTNTMKRYLQDRKGINSIPGNFILSIFEDSKGLIWVSINDAGLHLFNNANGKFTKYVDGIVFAMKEDRSGILWAGTNANGIKILDRNQTRFQKYLKKDLSSGEGMGNMVVSILEDEKNQLWVGTFGKGLIHLTKDRKILKTYVSNPSNKFSVSSNVIRCLCEVPDGSIWIGTNDGGLNKFDPKAGKFFRFKHDPANQNSISSDRIPALYYDAQSRSLWIGYETGAIDLLNLSTEKIVHYFPDRKDPKSLAPITGFFKSNSLGFIAATFSGGINKFIPDSNLFRPLQSPLNKAIFSICEDKGGIIWMCTDGRGIVRFDPFKNSVKYYLEEDGLPNNIVYSILPDNKGNFWLSTNKGISRFNIKTEKFRNYDPSDEYNEGAHYINKNGEMFFGGMDGLTAIVPDKIRDNEYIPPVYLTSFKVFERPIELSQALCSTNEIELDYSQSFFSFEFSALNYTSPEKNQYAFKLEGFDKDWHKVSASHRYASYTNLDPGEYILRIKGSNNDGIWNEKGTAITIIVKPPFWMTWWFYSLIFLTVISSIIAIYKYRIKQLLKIEHMRVRIASDLHDEIGSSLGSIVLRSRILQKDDNLTSKSKEELSRIHTTATATAAVMRDIVWFVNPDFDKLDDMILRMKDTAQSLLPNIPYEFNVPDGVLSVKLSLEFRRNVFLSYKEILHNISKHSKATEVRVDVHVHNGLFNLKISDNGIGFENVSEGNGLKNLKKRMDAIGGNVMISSEINKGTSVTITARTSRQKLIST